MLPIFWLVLWLAGPQSNAAPVGRATITGSVVRAGAGAVGAPAQLPDAQVELRPGNMMTYTNAAGTFTFRNVAPGRYTISVTRDGFIPQEDRQHGISVAGATVNVSAGQALNNVVLPMIPAPFITGRVIDPFGQPLATALIRAYKRQYTATGSRVQIVGKTMTNDLGEFRLFGLNFGDYLISAGYGNRDRATATSGIRLSENVSEADEGYSTIFYDGVEDIARADPIRLAPDTAPGPLNIYFRDSARFRIRGVVLPAGGGAKILFAPKGGDLTDAVSFTQSDSSGAFEVRGLSPGSYVLLATSADGTMSSDPVPVNVADRDVEGVRLTLAATVSVSGRLSLENSPRGVVLSNFSVELVRSSAEFDQRIEVPVNPDGTFLLENVSPTAEYDIAVDNLPNGTYIRTITSGGRNILRGAAPLTPGQPLQIGLAISRDNLDVRVTRAGEPAAGVEVVLIPDQTMRRREDRYIVGFTGAAGDLSLIAATPGQYMAYAFERLEAGAHYALSYDPAIAERFRNRAVAVTIGEGGTRSIQLTVIPADETAGILR